MATLPLKTSRKEVFCYSFSLGKRTLLKYHSLWDASSIW